jgi:predicted oxidoreductase (fatty acid repression mutant protein)
MTFWVINSNQVLFFVDYESLAPIKEKFAIYADKFDPFALESNAMSQYFGEYTSL